MHYLHRSPLDASSRFRQIFNKYITTLSRHDCLYYHENFYGFIIHCFGFGGLVVSMLASGTQDRGFDPGRSRRIFRAKKSTACLPWGGEGK